MKPTDYQGGSYTPLDGTAGSLAGAELVELEPRRAV
jgi:hypothetical protein